MISVDEASVCGSFADLVSKRLLQQCALCKVACPAKQKQKHTHNHTHITIVVSTSRYVVIMAFVVALQHNYTAPKFWLKLTNSSKEAETLGV